MKFMVTADDFGYCKDTFEETLRLYEKGVLDNISIMPNMPFSQKALEFSRSISDFSFGVHLTFCRDSIEAPLSGELSSLVGGDGKFFPRRSAQIRALLSMFSLDDIKSELRRQLDLVAEYVDISYVDSHMHLHKYPIFIRALEEVLPEFGVVKVRRPQNVFSRSNPITITRILGDRWARSLLNSFESTDYFFMGFEEGVPLELDSSSLAGVVEVGFHPGTLEPWKRLETESFLKFYQKVVSASERVSWTTF